MILRKSFRAWSAVALRLVCVLSAAGLAAVSGCSGGTGKIVPVEGKVTFNGAPVKGGIVNFHRETAGASAAAVTGTIDSDGNYKMTTGDKAGTPVGKYKVTVSAAPPAGDKDPMNMNKNGPVGAMPPAQLVPAKYGDPSQTTLTIEVVSNPAPDAYNLKLQ